LAQQVDLNGGIGGDGSWRDASRWTGLLCDFRHSTAHPVQRLPCCAGGKPPVERVRCRPQASVRLPAVDRASGRVLQSRPGIPGQQRIGEILSLLEVTQALLERLDDIDHSLAVGGGLRRCEVAPPFRNNHLDQITKPPRERAQQDHTTGHHDERGEYDHRRYILGIHPVLPIVVA
jgi:hypothetical protein